MNHVFDNSGRYIGWSLFDPDAVPKIVGWIQRDSGPERELTEAVDWAAECGELLVYHDWGDGGIMVAVYLDEAPEKRFHGRWKRHIRGGILNVPSGRLICQALEDTGTSAEAESDSGPGRDVAKLPPGRYFLAFNYPHLFTANWAISEVLYVHCKTFVVQSLGCEPSDRLNGGPQALLRPGLMKNSPTHISPMSA